MCQHQEMEKSDYDDSSLGLVLWSSSYCATEILIFHGAPAYSMAVVVILVGGMRFARNLKADYSPSANIAPVSGR
jgi:hypothetical protein